MPSAEIYSTGCAPRICHKTTEWNSIMFLMWILVLVMVIGLNIYLPWRTGNLFALQNKIWLYILFAAGLVSCFVSMSLKTRFDGILVSIFYNVSMTWLGIFIFLSCFMLIFEIVNLIHKLPPAKAGWAVVILTAILSTYSLINACSFKVSNIDIPVRDIENEVRIAQISDIHLGASRGERYLAKIVEKTNELNPDFAVITGDIADSGIALTKNMFTPLRNLKMPVYFVYGNHDVYIGLEEVIANLKENNVIILQNEILEVSGLKLVGLNYMSADDSTYDPHQVSDETIKDILPTLDLSGDNPIVVLHHGPWGIEYMNEHGVALILAGHTHGGQIFPATVIAGMRFPYNKGLHEYKGTYIYISQGAGTYFPIMRFGSNNEINFITLKPS